MNVAERKPGMMVAKKYRSPYDIRVRKHQRKLNKRKATKHRPSWMHWDCIIEVYKNCPKEKVVDHIIPLHGKNVSGLHVPWNLQYLTPMENVRKGNKVLV